MDDFNLTCSDEELLTEFTKGPCGYEPSADTTIELYKTIREEGSLPIGWCWELGRRSPSSDKKDSDSEKEDTSEKVDTSGFDFDEELTTPSLKMTPRRALSISGSRGSTKKRTPNFENILASVRRSKKLEADEKLRNPREKR